MHETINYQKKLDALLASLSPDQPAPRLLLHSCCGPCSSYVLEYLSRYFSITVYYYNPNIEPEAEYRKRLDEQSRLLTLACYPNPVALEPAAYDNARFRALTASLAREPEGGARCEVCIRMRMDQAAQFAKAGGYDYFTTTLSVSPHKNAPLINRLGEELSLKYQVPYLYGDFKKRGGYQRSIQLSRQFELYRQNYCGCLWAQFPPSI